MIQQETGVLDLLRPLLLDSDPSVQQNAALALGRLANYSPQLAEKIVASEIVPQLVASILKNNVCCIICTVLNNLVTEILSKTCSICAPSNCQTWTKTGSSSC